MGKNTFGGNKNKKFARKQINGSTNSSRLRLPEDEENEKIAIVMRMSGGSICRIKIVGNENELICHIRGKHRGRNKGSNLITAGVIVLIGLRVDMSSKEECDLLYVYDSGEIEQLKKFPNLKIMSLLNTDEYKSNKTDDGFIFTNEENIVFIDTETDEENVKGVFEDEINIDEI
jgi:initiation factor 1A